jgi:hypothetical protein
MPNSTVTTSNSARCLLGHEDPAYTLRRYVHRVAGALNRARAAIAHRYDRAA